MGTCGKIFTMNSSLRIPGTKRYEVNVRAVSGSMVTGNWPAHLNELMVTLDAPGLSQPSFTSIENDISKWWYAALEKVMLLGGIRLARKSSNTGQAAACSKAYTAK